MNSRLATFHIPSVDADDAALEAAWNEFEAELRGLGLRPADMATRSTATSATFRLFEVGHYEELEHAVLDFDIRKICFSAAFYPIGLAAAIYQFVHHLATNGALPNVGS